jgi:hypothetical protein
LVPWLVVAEVSNAPSAKPIGMSFGKFGERRVISSTASLLSQPPSFFRNQPLPTVSQRFRQWRRWDWLSFYDGGDLW